MPGMTPLRPDDVHSARAWAAFVADDAAAAPPTTLEARVQRAARAAMAQKQRDDAESRRRQWFAGCTALAASLLAAAAWSLAPHAPTTPASPTGTTPESRRERPADVDAIAATTPESSASVTPESDAPGRPMPMTNVEAGRVLARLPHARLASRPLFDPADGVGPIAAPGRLRAKSFAAPTVEPTFTKGRPTHAIAEPGAPALAAAPPMPGPLGPTVVGTAPDVWSSRGFNGVFDPDAAEKPVPPLIRLDQAASAPIPHEDPPAPPK